jgi:sulfonate transport system permease protein
VSATPPTIRATHAISAWLVPVGLVAVWEALARLGFIAPNVLPALSAVAIAGWDALLSGQLISNMWISTLRAISGLIVGGLIGFLFGLANGLSIQSYRYTDTTLQMVRNVPHLALIPLVILWFGIEEEAKLFLVALGVFFPIYINTLHGVRSVDPQLIEMARAYGMSRWTLVRRVILPGALPSIFVGLRFSLGIMWLTLIVAETISSEAGLGHMAMEAREFLLVDIVVLAIIIYALLGKLADVIARLLERRLLQWHPSFQTGSAS